MKYEVAKGSPTSKNEKILWKGTSQVEALRFAARADPGRSTINVYKISSDGQSTLIAQFD